MDIKQLVGVHWNHRNSTLNSTDTSCYQNKLLYSNKKLAYTSTKSIAQTEGNAKNMGQSKFLMHRLHTHVKLQDEFFKTVRPSDVMRNLLQDETCYRLQGIIKCINYSAKHTIDITPCTEAACPQKYHLTAITQMLHNIKYILEQYWWIKDATQSFQLTTQRANLTRFSHYIHVHSKVQTLRHQFHVISQDVDKVLTLSSQMSMQCFELNSTS